MKITKLLIAGVLAFSATLTHASTILYPTDGDVNFFVENGTVGAGVQLAIFNDSEAVANGAQITTSTGLLTVTLVPVNFAEGGVIDFLGSVGTGGVFLATNQTSIFTLDAINDNFIVGISTDNGGTWFADTGFSGGPANSGELSFNGLNGGSFVVDVQVAVIPVPAAAWLFASGLLGLVGVSRRRVA